MNTTVNIDICQYLKDTSFNMQVEQLRQRYAKGSYVSAGDVLVFLELARRYRNMVNALKDIKFG